MFDNSVSVLSKGARKLKAYLHVAEIIAQLIFISYYVYLLVTHLDDVVLLSAYATLLVLGVFVLFFKIFESDPYDRRGRIIKKKWRKAIRFIGWISRGTVIGYNVYYIVQTPTTDTAKLFLIFSGVVLLIEIILFIITSLFNKYYELFIYALKMDYEALNKGEENIERKPIGRILNDFNEDKDYEEEVNELYIEHEIFTTVKRYIEEDDISISLKRRELEKKLLSYYNRSSSYYNDIEYLVQLLKDINNIDKNDEIESHLYVLKFFLINHIDPVYHGLSKQSTRLVLSGLSLYRSEKEGYIIDLIFLTIIKELLNSNEWKEMLVEKVALLSKNRKHEELSTPEKMLVDVERIIKDSTDEYEIYEQGTVTSELKSMVGRHVVKGVSKSLKSRMKNIFKKK